MRRGAHAWAMLGFLVAATHRPAASDESFERVDRDIGLSHETVHAIVQDHRGFLWFGTEDGLDRFDAYDVEVLRHETDAASTLPSNVITALLCDRSDRLWIGTDNGLARLDAARHAIRRLALPSTPGAVGPAPVVYTFLEDRSGTIWIGTSAGLFRHDAAAEAAVAAAADGEMPTVVALQELPGSDVLGLVVVDGRTGRERLRGFDRRSRRFVDELPAAAEERRFWTAPALADVLQVQDGLTAPSPSYRHSPVRWAPDGEAWIGTQHGLYRFEPGTRRAERWPLGVGGDDYLQNFIRAVYRDTGGTLWVGTYGGLFRRDPYAPRFHTLTYDPAVPDGLGARAVSAVLAGSGGELWVATFGGGLARIDRDSGRGRSHRYDPSDPTSLPDDVVWTLLRDLEGKLWVGTASGLCAHVGGGRFERHALLDPSGGEHANVRDLAGGPDGALWIATTAGLFRYDPRKGTAERHPLSDDTTAATPSVEALAVDGHGRLWVAFERGPLVALRLDDGTVRRYALDEAPGERLSEALWTIWPSGDGDVWVGTTRGLVRLEPEPDAVRRFGPEEGLPGSVVYGIVEDGEGRLWLGTNQGLVVLEARGEDAWQLRTFDRGDGIGSREFNRRAAHRGDDGTLYFGGMDGLTWFSEDAVGVDPYPPPVVVTAARITGRDGTREVRLPGARELVLSPGDHTLGVEYVALDFTRAERNRYAYRLEPFDDEWIDAEDRRFARYTNLSAGRYVFRVRGANAAGVWNQDGASMVLRVLPPLWETGWFRALVLVVVGGLLTVAYRYRVARLLELERLRVRIADDLHDDLSSNLSGIALAGEQLQGADGLGARERERLERITATARRMVEDVRDIVWFVDPGHDRLDDLVRRMRETARDLLGDRELVFTVGGGTVGVTTPMQLRRHCFLAFKEILHNIVRHSAAGRVEVSVRRSGSHLRLEVADDGVGFEPDRDAAGHGRASLERRVREMGGKLEVDSRPDGGTRIVIDVPLG